MFKEVCEMLGTTRTTTTPYHPQSNGQVERANQTVQNMLKCICTETGKDWAEVAGFAASAYRSSQHESTGFSPNRMLFGRENVIPIDLIYGQPIKYPQCVTHYGAWLASTLLYTHQEAKTRLDDKLRSQKAYYDRRIKARRFEIGDLVVWLRPRVKKLENVWQGPYVVKNRLLERNYYTIERDGISRRATAEQLRQYDVSEATAGNSRSIPSGGVNNSDDDNRITSEGECEGGEAEVIPLTTYRQDTESPQPFQTLF
eukprot:GHVR01141751.1.p1 GENE.GHVR01141751.1~~GHVR01141751.1.p1  ORF type:complete len:257 (-),score=10.35 GHVR01141751.1:64-834(-)